MNLIRDMEAITASIDEEAASFKPLPGKWSKKELLGHLIDSAINNIKRFTEIRFTEKPYVVQPYKQDALVEANAYRDKPFRDIFFLWKELNKHIAYLTHIQTEDALSFPVVSATNKVKTLAWLIEDYVSHLVHHINQIAK